MPNQRVSVSSLKLVSMVVPEIPDIANIEAVYALEHARLAPMASETNTWLENSRAISTVLDAVYIKSLQDVGAKIGSSVICAALGALVSNGETSYRVEAIAGADVRATQPLVYKSTKTGVEQQGKLT